MKKAQMELMGLTIIVVLISLAFLFVVRFVILKPEAPDQNEFVHAELAANFLNTLLETNAPECSDAKYSSLFQDCANHYSVGGRVNCAPPYGGSCNYLRSKLDDLFTDTFKTWKIPYYLEVYRDPNNPSGTQLFPNDQAMGTPCTGDRKVKIQPLPLTPPDVLYLALYICA